MVCYEYPDTYINEKFFGKFMSLDSLERKLDEEEQRKKAEAARRAEEKKKRNALVNAAQKHEQSFLEKKVQMAEGIFTWAADFSQTELYKRISKISIERGVYVFGGGWGHRVPYDDGYGCWSRMYLKLNGSLFYWAGYKWMPTGPEFIVKSPQKLVEKLCYKYLSDFWRLVESKKVYDTIEKWHFKS